MPRTSSLGDIQRNEVSRTRDDQITVSVTTQEGAMDVQSRHERLVTAIAFVTLIACGIGVGIWASM
jgi:hypothetical protein